MKESWYKESFTFTLLDGEFAANVYSIYIK